MNTDVKGYTLAKTAKDITISGLCENAQDTVLYFVMSDGSVYCAERRSSNVIRLDGAYRGGQFTPELDKQVELLYQEGSAVVAALSGQGWPVGTKEQALLSIRQDLVSKGTIYSSTEGAASDRFIIGSSLTMQLERLYIGVTVWPFLYTTHAVLEDITIV